MGEYEDLVKEYYAFESESLGLIACELELRERPPEDIDVFQTRLDAVRRWMLAALQGQCGRMNDLKAALTETRAALMSAQGRMEVMERENEGADASLVRSRRSESASTASAEAEKRRESELAALRLRLDSSQREIEALLDRLKIQEALTRQEGRACAPPDAAQTLERSKAECAILKAAFLEAENRREAAEDRLGALESSRTSAEHSRTAEIDGLAARLRKSEAQNASLRERIGGMNAALAGAVSPEELDEESKKLKQRVVDLERTVAQRDEEYEQLRRKEHETRIFYDGFLQRIQSLESERRMLKAKSEATQTAPVPAPAEWERERTELQERLTVMQGDLANSRRAQELNERRWVETMTHQDMERLREIDLLKAEIERLKGAALRVI